MSLRIALPHHGPSVTAPEARTDRFGETTTPLYVGGLAVVAFLALLVWVGLF